MIQIPLRRPIHYIYKVILKQRYLSTQQQLTPSARLKIGRAIDHLQHDHECYLSGPLWKWTPPLDLVSNSVHLRTPFYSCQGVFKWRVVMYLCRLALLIRFNRHHSIKLQVVHKWQPAPDRLSLKWAVCAGDGSIQQSNRNPEQATVHLEGFSHFQFSPQTGFITHHTIDQLVPPVPKWWPLKGSSSNVEMTL